MLIDSVKRLICIPVEKVGKARLMIARMIAKKKTTQREVQELCGFLNFLGKCIVPGRAFTRRMYAQAQKVKKPHHHIPINKEFRMDLTMWMEFIMDQEIFARPFFEFQNDVHFSPIDFFTDASGTRGAGGYCGRQWFMIPWDQEFLREAAPSINYLELYALTVGIFCWLSDWRNRKIVIFCDNQSVIHMVNNTTSRCKNCMYLIRMITLHCLRNNVKLKVKYVPSAQNTFADLLSRLQYSKFRQTAKATGKSFEEYPVEIPSFLENVANLWMG